MNLLRVPQYNHGKPGAMQAGRGFTPYDVTQTVAWFSPRDAVTNVSGDASAWGTQYPAGAFTAAQPNGAIRPLIANGINGCASLTFSSDNLFSASNLVAAGATRYVLAVVKASNATGGSILTFRRGTRYWGLMSQDIGGNRYYFTDGVAISGNEVGAGPDFTTPRVIEWELTVGVPAVVRVDGAARTIAGGNLVAEDGTDGFDIATRAAAGLWAGDIGDIYIASGIPSAADKASLLAYFAGINGIAL